MKKYTQVAILLLLLAILGVEVYTTFIKKEGYTPGQQSARISYRVPTQSSEKTSYLTPAQQVAQSVNQTSSPTPAVQGSQSTKQTAYLTPAQQEALYSGIAGQLEEDNKKQVTYANQLGKLPFPLIIEPLQNNQITTSQAMKTLLTQVQATQGQATNGIAMSQVLGAVPPTRQNLGTVLTFLTSMQPADSGPIVTKMQNVPKATMQNIVDSVNAQYQSQGKAAINNYISSQSNVLAGLIKSGNANITDIANFIQVVQNVSAIPGEQPETISTIPPYAMTIIGGIAGLATGSVYGAASLHDWEGLAEAAEGELIVTGPEQYSFPPWASAIRSQGNQPYSYS